MLRLALVLAALPLALAYAAAPIDDGGSPYDQRRLDMASREAYHGRYSAAIAKTSAVIQASPNYAYAYLTRAAYYIDAGRFPEAEADIVRMEEFHPDTNEGFIKRAEIALRKHDPAEALVELKRAASAPTASRWKDSYEGPGNAPGTSDIYYASEWTAAVEYAYSSIAYEMLKQDTQALDTLAESLKLVQPDKSFRILARHCFYAALAGLSEMAELTCSEAISKQSHDIGDYDSLGLAHLKMKAWAKAIDDYSHALSSRDDLTTALYGRGIAKRATGDIAGGDADIGAATHDEPDIANIMARMGVPPS